MRLLLTIFCCLTTFLASAEVIGPVEFQLPNKTWKIMSEIETDTGMTIIYTRDGQPLEKAKDYFGVNTNKSSFDPVNAEVFKENLQKQFRRGVVETQILDRDKNSVLIEWSVTMDGKETIHSWSRAFNTKQGTIALSYQIFNDPSLVTQGRNDWLPLLKGASVKQF